MRMSLLKCNEDAISDTSALSEKIWRRRIFSKLLGLCSKIALSVFWLGLIVHTCMYQAFGATLSVVMSGTGQGSVNSSPPGIACPGSCSAAFTTFTLFANPGTGSVFTGWGGACAGYEVCTLTPSSDTAVNAIFDLKPLEIRVGGSYYGSLHSACSTIAHGGTVKSVSQNQPGDVLLDRAISFALAGGYDSSFSTNTGAITTVNGTMVIAAGSLTLSNICLSSSAPAPPAAPTGLKATSGDGQATLTWDAVTGASSYTIYHSTSAGVTRYGGTPIAGAASGQVISGLTNDTVYYIVVTALDAHGESVESAQVMITPHKSAPELPPAAPSGVVASAGNGKIDLAWSSIKGATSYTIYWSTIPGVTKASGTKIANIVKPPYQHAGLTNGITYYYMVTAGNSAGESAPSDEVSADPTLVYASKISTVATYNTAGMLTAFITYEYDASGRVSKMSTFGSTGVMSSYIEYEYDSAGRIFKTSTHTLAGGQDLYKFTTTEYNDAGKATLISNYMYVQSYGAFLDSYIVNVYDDAGNLTSSSTCNGFTHLVTSGTTYEYNAEGNVTKQTYVAAQGIIKGYATTEYNAAGKPVLVSNYDMNGDRSTYVTTDYNEAGKEWKITKYNGFSNEIMDCTVYDYDDAGNRIKTSNYDFAGLLTGYTTVAYNSAKMPLNVSVYGPTGLLKMRTVNSYIAIGSISRESSFNAGGELTGYVLNDYNGVGKISMASYFDATDKLLKYVMTEYDEALRVAMVSTYDSSGLKEYSVYAYDDAGRLATVSTFGPDAVLTKSVSKEYNAAGSVTRENNYDGAGSITGYVLNDYNAIGKVSKARFYTPANALSKYTANDYDALGRKIMSSRYDAADKLTEYTTTEYNEAGKQVKNSTYDGAGLLKTYTAYEYGH